MDLPKGACWLSFGTEESHFESVAKVIVHSNSSSITEPVHRWFSVHSEVRLVSDVSAIVIEHCDPRDIFTVQRGFAVCTKISLLNQIAAVAVSCPKTCNTTVNLYELVFGTVIRDFNDITPLIVDYDTSCIAASMQDSFACAQKYATSITFPRSSSNIVCRENPCTIDVVRSQNQSSCFRQ